MLCYLINLASQPERLARMERIFEGLGLEVERFDAIGANDINRHPLLRHIPARRYSNWVPGELGCMLSHYEIWLRLIDRNIDVAAVFEDDVHVDPRLPMVLSAVPTSVELLKLETLNWGPIDVSRASIQGSADVFFHRLRSSHPGSAGYVIRRTAAMKLVNRAAVFDLPVDHLLFQVDHPAQRGLRSYQAVPAMIIQDAHLPERMREGGWLATGIEGRNPGTHQPQRARALLLRLIRAPMIIATRSVRWVLRRIFNRQLHSPALMPRIGADAAQAFVRWSQPPAEGRELGDRAR